MEQSSACLGIQLVPGTASRRTLTVGLLHGTIERRGRCRGLRETGREPVGGVVLGHTVHVCGYAKAAPITAASRSRGMNDA